MGSLWSADNRGKVKRWLSWAPTLSDKADKPADVNGHACQPLAATG